DRYALVGGGAQGLHVLAAEVAQRARRLGGRFGVIRVLVDDQVGSRVVVVVDVNVGHSLCPGVGGVAAGSAAAFARIGGSSAGGLARLGGALVALAARRERDERRGCGQRPEERGTASCAH